MHTVLFSRKRPDGIRLITVLNVEDEAMENFRESIGHAIQMFEESWDRPIRTLEEIGEELHHSGIYIVENASIFEMNDDEIFENYDYPFVRPSISSNDPIQISHAPTEEDDEALDEALDRYEEEREKQRRKEKKAVAEAKSSAKKEEKKKPADEKSLLGKKGGRKAVKISREEFIRKADKIFEQYGHPLDGIEFEDGNDRFSLEAFMTVSSVSKDLSKVAFDTENETASLRYSPPAFPVEESLLGLHTLDNGLTFVGFTVGGDCEQPIYVIIYWDGKSFRGYIPMLGNTVNTILMCAFGAESESDYGPYGSKASKVYEKHYAGLEDEELMSKCYHDLGYSEYGEDQFADWSLIEKDIRNRIVVD